MTGIQTRLASEMPGWYRQIFTGCPNAQDTDNGTTWRFVRWNAEVPAGEWIVLNVRSSSTVAGLANQPWITVACITPPGGEGQATIKMLNGNFVEVEARLSNQTETSSRLKNLSVLYECSDLK